MSGYSTSFSRYRAYNVTPVALAGLVSAANAFLETSPTITIHMEDDHDMAGVELDDLLADSLVRNKIIKRVDIDGRKTLREPLVSRSISITFEADFLQVVKVGISGERDRSLTARREIETILEGAEYWYAPIFLPRTMLVFQVSIFLPIALAAVAAVFLTWLFGGVVTQTSVTFWVLLPFAILLGVYFGLKDRIFPKLTFDIGRSADRIQSARYWRNILLTSIIIGIAGKLAIDRLLK